MDPSLRSGHVNRSVRGRQMTLASRPAPRPGGAGLSALCPGFSPALGDEAGAVTFSPPCSSPSAHLRPQSQRPLTCSPCAVRTQQRPAVQRGVWAHPSSHLSPSPRGRCRYLQVTRPRRRTQAPSHCGPSRSPVSVTSVSSAVFSPLTDAMQCALRVPRGSFRLSWVP